MMFPLLQQIAAFIQSCQSTLLKAHDLVYSFKKQYDAFSYLKRQNGHSALREGVLMALCSKNNYFKLIDNGVDYPCIVVDHVHRFEFLHYVHWFRQVSIHHKPHRRQHHTWQISM